MGSLTCAQIWVHAVHTKGDQSQTSLHKSWLGWQKKLLVTLPRQGIEPRVFRFKSWLSNHWATSPLWWPFVRRSSVSMHSMLVKLGEGLGLVELKKKNSLFRRCLKDCTEDELVFSAGGRRHYVWPSLTKGLQSRWWEDHDITGENIPINGSFLSFFCFWHFYVVGCLFYHFLTAHSQF